MPPVRVDREPPFKLSMTVDFFGDGGRGLYTLRTLDLMMREARRLGGSLQCFNPFMERFPHTRIQRRPLKSPPNLQTTPIRQIRLVKRDDSPTRIRARHLEIWGSPDNYRYRRRRVRFRLEDGRVSGSKRRWSPASKKFETITVKQLPIKEILSGFSVLWVSIFEIAIWWWPPISKMDPPTSRTRLWE